MRCDRRPICGGLALVTSASGLAGADVPPYSDFTEIPGGFRRGKGTFTPALAINSRAAARSLGRVARHHEQWVKKRMVRDYLMRLPVLPTTRDLVRRVDQHVV